MKTLIDLFIDGNNICSLVTSCFHKWFQVLIIRMQYILWSSFIFEYYITLPLVKKHTSFLEKRTNFCCIRELYIFFRNR